MSMLKIGSIPPASAVPPNILAPRGAEGGRGEAVGTPMTPDLAAARAPNDYSSTSAKGVQQDAAFNQDTRRRVVGEVVAKVNDTLDAFGTTSLRLTYDHERQLVIMRMVKTGEQPGQPEEVIWQMPPEELLSCAERLEELQGLLFDRQV